MSPASCTTLRSRPVPGTGSRWWCSTKIRRQRLVRAEALLDPGVAPAADHAVVEVGLGGVHRHDRDAVRREARSGARRTAPRSARSPRCASRGCPGSRSSARTRCGRGSRAPPRTPPRRPSPVRSPDTITTSGSSSLISTSARSSRLGTKCGEPQCRSEIWAIVKALTPLSRAQGRVQQRARPGRDSSQLARTAQEVPRARHVVHAQHRAPEVQRRLDRAQRAGVALGRTAPGDRADEVLAGDREQQRPPQRLQLGEAPQHLDGLLGVLARSRPGSSRSWSSPTPSSRATRDRSRQELDHVGHHVVVVREGLRSSARRACG